MWEREEWEAASEEVRSAWDARAQPCMYVYIEPRDEKKYSSVARTRVFPKEAGERSAYSCVPAFYVVYIINVRALPGILFSMH